MRSYAAHASATFANARDRHQTIGDFAEKSGDSKEGAAKSAAIDPELAELLGRWKNLPPVIKSAILAIARQHPVPSRDSTAFGL